MLAHFPDLIAFDFRAKKARDDRMNRRKRDFFLW